MKLFGKLFETMTRLGWIHAFAQYQTMTTKEWASWLPVSLNILHIFHAVGMEICVFHFWFGDIYKLTAGVP